MADLERVANVVAGQGWSIYGAGFTPDNNGVTITLIAPDQIANIGCLKTAAYVQQYLENASTYATAIHDQARFQDALQRTLDGVASLGGGDMETLVLSWFGMPKNDERIHPA